MNASMMALYGPARLAMSDEQVARAKANVDTGIDAWKQAVGLKVDVHVDREGNATVNATADDGRQITSAMARQGAM